DTRACEAAGKLEKKRGFVSSTTRRASPPVGPPTANVQVGSPSVEGSLPGLPRTLARVEGKVRSCHAQGLAENPGAAGKLQVRLQVTAEGKVKSVQVTSGSGLSPKVGECVRVAFAGASFDPAPGEPAEVTVPILLNSGE
ncbi:MAG: AgmX/PglI C-terminal domain-containing protein, partial [Myxococcales bacterium]